MTRDQDYKARMKQGYDQIASHYDSRMADYSARFCADLIDLMFPQLGESALDLAGGSGAAAMRLAERVGPRGSVTLIDLSPSMLEIAARKAADRKLTTIRTCVMDAENLEFPDRSFDLLTCAQAAMAFPRIQKAVSEAIRVLKPGGRIGFTAWSVPERIPFISFPTEAVLRRIAPQPVRALLHAPMIGRPLAHLIMAMRGPLGYSPLRFSAPGTLERHLSDAGFQSVRRELRAYPIEFKTFGDYWETLTRGTTMQSMDIPGRVLDEVRSELSGKLANQRDGGVLLFNEVALILARKAA
jgi:ubiquinone/menaquinone biosynthesis C-methylase UbiE